MQLKKEMGHQSKFKLLSDMSRNIFQLTELQPLCCKGPGLVSREAPRLLGEGDMTRQQCSPVPDQKSLVDNPGRVQRAVTGQLREDPVPELADVMESVKGETRTSPV